MTRLNFICEFKSDIVLHSSSNTEGKIDKFNYIAGSNFLGMVARAYQDFGTDAFEVFHSGKVRFLDGHIITKNQKTFHAPFSWFAPKGFGLSDAIKKKKLYNDHFITHNHYEAFIQEGKQLKQQRGSFVTQDGQVAELNANYRQKSAYDKHHRRSQDGAMFGYHALKKGTQWAFEVELDNLKYKNKIITLLESSKRLGKSRSAEYGRVKIKFIDEKESALKHDLKPIKIEDEKGKKDKWYVFLYAYSRLALTDDSGINSYKPTLTTLKFDNAIKIDWDKSQIRTNRYTPYVSIRHNRDPERLIMEKGSVIAVEVSHDFDVQSYRKKIEKGLGLYLSEGHGKVIVNPEFLTTKEPKLEEPQAKNNSESTKDTVGVIGSWLREQQKKEASNYALLKEVKVFISEHKVKNKKSQWGQVRSLAHANITSESLHKALFDEEVLNGHPQGFLLHGQAKDKWDIQLVKALQNRKLDDSYHDFIKMLSIYAPKEDDKREETRDV